MGWSEILIVAVVALIVVGPKDLPVLFQSLGKMTAKVRRMAREFSQAMNEAADSTGMKDVAKDLRNVASPKNMGMDVLKDAAEKFDKWEPPTPGKRGPETAKMTEERKADAEKIREGALKRAQERKAREAEAQAAEEMADQDAPQATLPDDAKPTSEAS